ncbi:MAG: Ig-like domain-containing protein, partial [Nocardioidaceae bacterium]
LSDTGTLTVYVNTPPSAGDASVTVNPGEAATLTPEVSAGTATLTSVVFDNGETTLVVAGEGTWTIELTAEGEVVATFTPEDGYFGAVTSQTYTATDENGLTASGELSVEINDPPTARDDSATINPGETATFDPLGDLVTAGSSTDLTVQLVDPATGEPTAATTVTVKGQGTWTLNTTTGEITFTPNDGFTGTATIGYRVTDGNTLYDEATLTVTVTAAVVDDTDDSDDTTDSDNTGSSDDTDDSGSTDSGGHSSLPVTGADIAAGLIGGLGLLVAGAGLVLVARRRREVD